MNGSGSFSASACPNRPSTRSRSGRASTSGQCASSRAGTSISPSPSSGTAPRTELPGIVDALRAAAAGVESGLRLTPARYRETRSVAMLVYDDEGGRGGRLAADVQERLERLGVYRREGRDWLPHLTVGRFRQRPGLRLDPPNMGTYVLIPSDASAYLSRLRPGGAQYEVLETVALGGS